MYMKHKIYLLNEPWTAEWLKLLTLDHRLTPQTFVLASRYPPQVMRLSHTRTQGLTFIDYLVISILVFLPYPSINLDIAEKLVKMKINTNSITYIA